MLIIFTVLHTAKEPDPEGWTVTDVLSKRFTQSKPTYSSGFSNVGSEAKRLLSTFCPKDTTVVKKDKTVMGKIFI